jgi:hypothetical protein
LARIPVDPRAKELIDALTKEQRKLNNLIKENQFAGVDLSTEIAQQEKKVEAAQKKVNEFTEGLTGLSDVKEKAKTKQQELKERESRALEERASGQITQDVSFPTGRDGQKVSGQLTAETQRVKKTQLDQAEQETVKETTSAFERSLTPSQTRREMSGAGVSIAGAGIEEIQPVGPGKFVVERKFDQDPDGYFILPGRGSLVSRLISVNDFTNNLYGLDSAVVSEYQKALGLSQSGVMNRELEDKIVSLVEDISYVNYRNALGGRPQIQWEEALINPEKFNLKKGEKGPGSPKGPSPEQIQARAQSIQLLSTELGIDIDKKDLQKLARDWATGLYDANTIKAQIARVGTIDFNKGAAAETLNTLKQYASDFGIEFDETWFNKATTRVLKYRDDIETYNQQIKDLAKSQYPTLAAQIDSGFTVRQLASPYIQNMSRILEIDSGTIGLNDKTIKQALTGLNPEGQPMTTPLWQFEQQLRQDPRWNYTNNAQEDLMGTARQILKNFGLVS